MSPETARRIRENIHLIRKKDFYNFLGFIPYTDLEEVINLLISWGVEDPFSGNYPDVKRLHDDVVGYNFPPVGTHFVTTDRVELSFVIPWIGEMVGDYIRNLYHSPGVTTNRLSKDILAMWDDIDDWNDISEYWINRINELFYEADNWKIELTKDAITGDVSLIILPKSEVKIIDDGGEPRVWIEGLLCDYGNSGLSNIKIKFDRFEAE